MPSVSYQESTLFFDDIGKGTPLVFLHPPGMGRVVFTKQHTLAKHFRLIIPDLSGHGDSPSLKTFVSIDSYVEEINFLLDHLKLSTCVLIGYSAGGIVAQRFAAAYKDKVSSLILIGAYPKVIHSKLKLMHLTGMKLARNHPGRLAKLISKAHTKSKEEREQLVLHMNKANPEIWYHFYKQSLQYDGIEEINHCKLPLLLIYGEKSDWVNDQVECYRDCHPKKVYFIPGASHEIPTLHHDALNAILLGEVENLLKKD
jgi:pimeloyl-ACP methyl ester carboxylesterase